MRSHGSARRPPARLADGKRERVGPAALSFGRQSGRGHRGLRGGAAGDADERHENQ